MLPIRATSNYGTFAAPLPRQTSEPAQQEIEMQSLQVSADDEPEPAPPPYPRIDVKARKTPKGEYQILSVKEVTLFCFADGAPMRLSSPMDVPKGTKTHEDSVSVSLASVKDRLDKGTVNATFTIVK